MADQELINELKEGQITQTVQDCDRPMKHVDLSVASRIGLGPTLQGWTKLKAQGRKGHWRVLAHRETFISQAHHDPSRKLNPLLSHGIKLG